VSGICLPSLAEIDSAFQTAPRTRARMRVGYALPWLRTMHGEERKYFFFEKKNQ
jgi:hypothetical protein